MHLKEGCKLYRKYRSTRHYWGSAWRTWPALAPGLGKKGSLENKLLFSCGLHSFSCFFTVSAKSKRRIWPLKMYLWFCTMPTELKELLWGCMFKTRKESKRWLQFYHASLSDGKFCKYEFYFMLLVQHVIVWIQSNPFINRQNEEQTSPSPPFCSSKYRCNNSCTLGSISIWYLLCSRSFLLAQLLNKEQSSCCYRIQCPSFYQSRLGNPGNQTQKMIRSAF